ncbi:MAG: HAD-IA family hydrolase, partial [Syntrophobacteraceae bacterium]
EGLALIEALEMEAALKGCLFSFPRPLLRDLLHRNLRVAIITRNCDSAVRRVFPDIADYCHSFLARDHVPSPKPDPAHLISALKAINACSGAALMVGDHPIDIQTGKAAGTLTAGVSSGNASREDLLLAGADWVACDCEELMGILTESGALA